MKKIARILALAGIIVVFLVAIFASLNHKTSPIDKVWDEDMTLGNPDAANYFIVYSDLVCPYCIAFENAIVENEADFQKYLEDNDILFEVRLSDFLYEYGETHPINSRYAAEAAYCAKNAGRFWDYYNLAVTTVWNDFFKNSGKSAVSQMANLGPDYWLEIGHQIGLGPDFDTCVANHDTIDDVSENATKTAKLVTGMPYFKFNNYTSSGFDLSWGWGYVLMYFQAGLDSK